MEEKIEKTGFDEFFDSRVKGRQDQTPPSTSSVPDFLSSPQKPSVNSMQSVVIDEKAFKPGMLFAAINKGMTTLSFKHGKGLRITRNGDWVVIQILDAGCGALIKHQSAPPSQRKIAKNNKSTLDAKGSMGTVSAWSE